MLTGLFSDSSLILLPSHTYTKWISSTDFVVLRAEPLRLITVMSSREDLACWEVGEMPRPTAPQAWWESWRNAVMFGHDWQNTTCHTFTVQKHVEEEEDAKKQNKTEAEAQLDWTGSEQLQLQCVFIRWVRTGGEGLNGCRRLLTSLITVHSLNSCFFFYLLHYWSQVSFILELKVAQTSLQHKQIKTEGPMYDQSLKKSSCVIIFIQRFY